MRLYFVVSLTVLAFILAACDAEKKIQATPEKEGVTIYPVAANVAPKPIVAQKPLVGLAPMTSPLSPDGYQLILDWEVGGGERYYDKFLLYPDWPGESSGVTVGVGYDCGYNSAAVIRSDWSGLEQVDELEAVSGITGTQAKGKARQLHDILIAWGLAERVFNNVTVTRFYHLTERTYPGFEDLKPNCQAALVSLVFNRGNSLQGPRRTEMLAIYDLVPRKDYAGIAAQIRRMKRLWPDTPGLVNRREAEAKLIETC